MLIPPLMNLKPQSPIQTDYCYQKDFKYTHQNPYHHRLESFEEFVLRDTESETHQNQWQKLFDKVGSLQVEIGTGFGEFMIDYCEKNPDKNFVGLDHRFKRSFQLAKRLSQIPKRNFKYLRARAERLEFIFGENEIENIYYFFPDPWPKTRHHKKRLFQKPFLMAAHKTLKPGGKIYIKTDHDGYYEWMLKYLVDQDLFKITFKTCDLYKEFPDHFLAQFQTKFEKIFLRKKILIKALVLEVQKG